MHFTFFAYGKRDSVERMLRDMEAQKHRLKVTNPITKEEKFIWLQGVIRTLPGGIYDYIFPKEDMDIVLNTMCPPILNVHNRFKVSKTFLAVIRKALKLKKCPKYKDAMERYLWIKDGVAIIPIGIREDEELAEPIDGEFKGWIHEAL